MGGVAQLCVTFITGILIKFKGEANVQWTETESRKNSDGTTEEHTVFFQGNEKYFESKYHLVGGHGKYMMSKIMKNNIECDTGYWGLLVP